MSEKELDPLKDLVKALNEEVDLPTRMNTDTHHPPKGGSASVTVSDVIAAGYDWEPMPEDRDE